MKGNWSAGYDFLYPTKGMSISLGQVWLNNLTNFLKIDIKIDKQASWENSLVEGLVKKPVKMGN